MLRSSGCESMESFPDRQRRLRLVLVNQRRSPTTATAVRPATRCQAEQERDQQADKEDLRDEDAQSTEEQNEQEKDE